ncbi:hypothetical protein AVEN_10127-1 [Araneus ventricosus]|uniref:Uncharacterized protein n=1 Tax=Araneus ventricosus TaxID=182803 RepID=A0A4Y2HEE4_ARAVE|nr:hypothetical protein AVEN_10127-1 [Araneus ventricosus]
MALSITSTNEWSVGDRLDSCSLCRRFNEMFVVDRLDFPPRHLLCSVTHGMGKKLLVADDLGGSYNMCFLFISKIQDNLGYLILIRGAFSFQVEQSKFGSAPTNPGRLVTLVLNRNFARLYICLLLKNASKLQEMETPSCFYAGC